MSQTLPCRKKPIPPWLFFEPSASRDIQHNSILLEPLSKARTKHDIALARERKSPSTYPPLSKQLSEPLLLCVSCRLGTSSSVQKEPREPTYCNCESSNSYPKYVLPWSRPIQLIPSNFETKARVILIYY